MTDGYGMADIYAAPGLSYLQVYGQGIVVTDVHPIIFPAITGGGTITGATTSGGLVVTGTTLGLLKTCSSNQVLQWNGSAWVCATISGGGTVTGTGTTNTIPLWTGASVLGNSLISQASGTITAAPTGQIGFSTLPVVPNLCGNGSATIPTAILIGGGGCVGLYTQTVPNVSPSTSQTAAFQAQNLLNTASNQEMLGISSVVSSGNGTATTALEVGIEADTSEASGSATVTRQIGLVSSNTISAHTTATQQGLYVINGASGGTVTNSYGLYVDSPLMTGGTLTHEYGLYVADQTTSATDPHGIVTVGTAPSSFGGAVTVSGVIDGKAPVTITTATACTVGLVAAGCPYASAYSSGYTDNQEATAGQAVTYALPTAAAGLSYCFDNSYNGSAADTGILTIAASAAGQFIIFTDGTISATGGNVTSAGAGGDAACVRGVDATHWQLYVQRGVWTKH